jgi:hypothetical protein
MGYKNVIDLVEGYPSRQVIGDRTGPHIKYEIFTITKFDIYGGLHLSRAHIVCNC